MNEPVAQVTQSIPLSEVEQSLYEIRKKIHPRSVQGWFSNWRIYMVVFTQLIFYGLPWLNWHGRQAVLLDLAARKFYIFGMVLWPQDVFFLTLLLIISAFSLFLFTAVAGRLFCGYACPQTVYTEVFLWIERYFEGDRIARIRLDSDPWSARKLRIKTCKHLAWAVVALWTGYTFVGYFAPIRALASDVLSLTLGPWQLFWMLFYSFATWGNAGFMREQVCKYMCPYARFQSVMVDKDTLVVTYDTNLGEPRGKRNKKADYQNAGLGTCVDCSLCVQVCPTGIDIRNGLQYECIGCGACIDACDQVMEKMNYPKGLVSYKSENAMHQGWTLAERKKHILRPRVLIYTAILLVLVSAFVVLLFTRHTLRMDVIRDRGVLARKVGDGEIENIYQLHLMNASEQATRVMIRAEGLPDLRPVSQVAEETSDNSSESQQSIVIDMPAEANRLIPLKLRALEDNLEDGSHKIKLLVYQVNQDNQVGKFLLEEPTRFMVPKSPGHHKKDEHPEHAEH